MGLLYVQISLLPLALRGLGGEGGPSNARARVFRIQNQHWHSTVR